MLKFLPQFIKSSSTRRKGTRCVEMIVQEIKDRLEKLSDPEEKEDSLGEEVSGKDQALWSSYSCG